jgi:ParB-like nuclease domain
MSESEYQAAKNAVFRQIRIGLHDSRLVGRERDFLGILETNPKLNTEEIITLVLSDAAGVAEGPRPAAGAEAIAAPEAGNSGRQDEGVATSTRTELPLSAIRADSRAQAREGRNAATIEDYREKMEDGVVFPPLAVFFDGEAHWLADGFHRFEAAQAAGRATIRCYVREGGLRDAILFSVGANTAHGLRRTNADKRRAVMTLLRDKEWRAWSDHKIAQICGVSQPFVSKLRQPVDTENVISMNRTFVHPKTGRPTTMKTNQIGGRQQRPADTKVVQLRDRRPPLPSCESFEHEAAAEEAAAAVPEDKDFSDQSEPEQRAHAIAEALNTFDRVAITGREFVQVNGRGSADVYVGRARKAQAVLTEIITEMEKDVSERTPSA